MSYIEIKTRKYIDATLAQQIIDKRTVIGILSVQGKSQLRRKRGLIALVSPGQNTFLKTTL